MNKIVRRMWEKETTLEAWSAKNGFNPRYVRHIVAGHRGKWRVGKCERIIRALLLDGFLKSEEELVEIRMKGKKK